MQFKSYPPAWEFCKSALRQWSSTPGPWPNVSLWCLSGWAVAGALLPPARQVLPAWNKQCMHSPATRLSISSSFQPGANCEHVAGQRVPRIFFPTEPVCDPRNTKDHCGKALLHQLGVRLVHTHALAYLHNCGNGKRGDLCSSFLASTGVWGGRGRVIRVDGWGTGGRVGNQQYARS